MTKHDQFLTELADLMEKHDAEIWCYRNRNPCGDDVVVLETGRGLDVETSTICSSLFDGSDVRALIHNNGD